MPASTGTGVCRRKPLRLKTKRAVTRHPSHRPARFFPPAFFVCQRWRHLVMAEKRGAKKAAAWNPGRHLAVRYCRTNLAGMSQSVMGAPNPRPSMRRPVSVKLVLFSSSRCHWPLRQAASVAILPSALFDERFLARCKVGVLISVGAAT